MRAIKVGCVTRGNHVVAECNLAHAFRPQLEDWLRIYSINFRFNEPR